MGTCADQVGCQAPYGHVHQGFAFCKKTPDFTNADLSAYPGPWYTDFGNGLCGIGKTTGGVGECASICSLILGCHFFSVSTTTNCWACFIYKACDYPLTSSYDY